MLNVFHPLQQSSIHPFVLRCLTAWLFRSFITVTVNHPFNHTIDRMPSHNLTFVHNYILIQSHLCPYTTTPLSVCLHTNHTFVNMSSRTHSVVEWLREDTTTPLSVFLIKQYLCPFVLAKSHLCPYTTMHLSACPKKNSHTFVGMSSHNHSVVHLSCVLTQSYLFLYTTFVRPFLHCTIAIENLYSATSRLNAQRRPRH